MYFLVIFYLIFKIISDYKRINSMIKGYRNEGLKKYKNVKFILLYQKGDNINESIKSLLKIEDISKEIIIIGKNIKINHPAIKIYNQSYCKNIINKIIKEIHKTDNIIGVFRANTIFDRNLINKIINYFNNHNVNKLYVLSNIITNNKYIQKYNFYHQLNSYADNSKYDYFTNLSNHKDAILNNFLITKIINLSSFQYIFYGEPSLKYYFILIIKYAFIFYFPSLLFIAYFLQLIKQIIIICSNLKYNQALEQDVPDIVFANFLTFLKDLMPNIRLQLNKMKIDTNDSCLIPKLKLIKKIENGIFYQVENTNLEILHLYGSSYQKGYAHGKLCKHHFQKMVKTMNTLCQNLKPHNIDMGRVRNEYSSVKECLLDIYQKLEKFIKDEHKDEMKGISDGSNIDYQDIIAISIIPELFHQHCMLLNKLDGNDNIFLRTLDFFFYCDTHILKVYHNSDKNSYCELGIPGSIWTLSAVSEKLICLGETSGTLNNRTNLLGTPFYFYFKEILQNCNNLNEAIELTKSTKRNNNLFFLIASLFENKSTLIESSEVTNFYNRDNFEKYLGKFSANKIDNFRKDVIFEYASIEELNHVLLDFNDFSIDNIKTGILDLFKTGGNHMMMVNSKQQLFIRFNDANKTYCNIYLFNLKELFDLK